jgi:hypothetical protein
MATRGRRVHWRMGFGASLPGRASPPPSGETEKMVEAMEKLYLVDEEARVAGALPGWLR